MESNKTSTWAICGPDALEAELVQRHERAGADAAAHAAALHDQPQAAAVRAVPGAAAGARPLQNEVHRRMIRLQRVTRIAGRNEIKFESSPAMP
jgi:hypothetical protein